MAFYFIIGTDNSGYKEVYVSRTGNEAANCGQQTQPCKSIAQAVRQVEWSGQIYLDGTGTEQHPYDCDETRMYAGHSGITVQKSLRMEGINLTPHVSCYGGFKFQNTSRELSIVLSGIAFRQTPLRFEGCNLVKVVNCSFRNATTALTVYIKNNNSTLLDIRGFSLFENNTSCLEVFTSNNQDQSLKVNVSDTTFQGNRNRFTKGTITVKSEMRKSSVITHVQISCFKVTYMNNYGYFVNIDLPAATTNEVYSNVTLVDNTVSHLIRSSFRGTYTAVESLYTSRARKSHVGFINLQCSYNHFLRCLRIQSEEANVEVSNSSFVGQSILTGRGAAVSLESKTNASLVLTNSKFRRNKAKSGGALFVHSKDGIIELTITRVNFTECAAVKFGCALLVGDPNYRKLKNRTVTYKLTATFREVRVQNCFGAKAFLPKGCIIFFFLLFNGNFAINDSSWTNNLNSVAAALMVKNAGGKTNVAISGCTFVSNTVLSPGVVMLMAVSKQAGSVTVENCTLTNPKSKASDLYISPQFKIRVINVLFKSSSAIGLSIIHPKKMRRAVSSVNIYIHNCVFLNNAHDILVDINNPAEISFAIRNTIFTTKMAKHKDFGIFFQILVDSLTKVKSSNAIIQLDNATFESRPTNVFQLNFPGKTTLKIQRSAFRGGVCFRKYVPRYNPLVEVGTGAISILSNHDKLNRSGCVEKHKNENIHPLWNYNTDVIFEDTTFEANAGLIAGAVYISNGNVTFNRCRFRDNFATKRSGHVYSAYGTGRVNFKDCSFSTSISNLTVNGTIFDKSTFLYSESGGPVKFENTSMALTLRQRMPCAVVDISSGGYVDMDNSSTIECSTGSQLLFENNTHFVYVYNGKNGSSCRVNVTVLKYSCNLCPPGYYSLQKGVSHGLKVHTSIQCLPCPFGATCIEKNIAAKPNFWGYPNSDCDHPPSLSFYACPERYCQSPTKDSNEYNSCYGNRSGFLCGKCDPKYSETLFSTECRKTSECNNYMLWIMTILYTTGIAFYLLIKPPVLTFLGRQILWFRKREGYSVIQELGSIDSHSDSGYLKITFYFYQAAELLIVGSTEEFLYKIPFILAIVDVFNFHVRSLHRLIDCPLAGLTAVTKKLFFSGTVFLTMTELVVIYGLHVAFNKIRRKQKPSLIHYMAVIVELLLLGYERLAETSLKLMHCVSIGSEKRLFIDAEIACWQWWQYILLTYVIVSVVPFIMVLYFGSSKLYNATISARQFLGACMLPLPFLVYWLLKQMIKRDDDSRENRQTSREVLEVLHGPFRQPSENDSGTLYWESILIGRRFILLSCHAFITNAMFKMVCMTTASVLMLVHHVLKNPYHDPIANKAESSSLLTLVMMAVINLSKATLISFGTSIVGPTKSYLEALEWFEICALAFVPTLLCIFAVFAVCSQLVRLIVSLTKLISSYVRLGTLTLRLTELQTPILDTSEAD